MNALQSDKPFICVMNYADRQDSLENPRSVSSAS